MLNCENNESPIQIFTGFTTILLYVCSLCEHFHVDAARLNDLVRAHPGGPIKHPPPSLPPYLQDGVYGNDVVDVISCGRRTRTARTQEGRGK